MVYSSELEPDELTNGLYHAHTHQSINQLISRIILLVRPSVHRSIHPSIAGQGSLVHMHVRNPSVKILVLLSICRAAAFRARRRGQRAHDRSHDSQSPVSPGGAEDSASRSSGLLFRSRCPLPRPHLEGLFLKRNVDRTLFTFFIVSLALFVQIRFEERPYHSDYRLKSGV